MRHDNRSPRLSMRLRALGATFLPLLLALALPACGNNPSLECDSATLLLAPALTVAGGVVYAHGTDGISALRAGAGALAWRTTSDSIRGHPTPPVVAGGVVIASLAMGKLIARRSSDGSLAWHSQPTPRPWHGDSQLLPVLTVADGVVYAAASADSIAAWHVADGTLLWQSPPLTVTTSPAYGSSYPYTQAPEPVVAGDVVYFVAGNVVGAVRATDGSLLWSSPALSKENLATPPALAGGQLFIVAPDGSLSTLAADTGAVLWHAPDPDLAATPGSSSTIPAPPIVRNGVVYYAPSDGLRALGADTGHLLWRLPAVPAGNGSAPVVNGGVVYVATSDSLVALDARTGSERWEEAMQVATSDGAKLVNTAGSIVLVNGATVYTIAPGFVAAWNASTGTSRWQRVIESSQQMVQMVSADGVIYLSNGGYIASCSDYQVPPAVSAIRASDGALLWQTSMPVA